MTASEYKTAEAYCKLFFVILRYGFRKSFHDSLLHDIKRDCNVEPLKLFCLCTVAVY
jgi:hypothetical protein